MATTSNDNSREEQFKCPICENSYAGPRKLPECGHQCCEVCILAYVSKLREDGDIEIGFPCLSWTQGFKSSNSLDTVFGERN